MTPKNPNPWDLDFLQIKNCCNYFIG